MKAVTLSILLGLCSSINIRQHSYSMDTSQVISNEIKETILSNINLITNKQVRDQLAEDLRESDDSKRKLTSIDVLSAKELFLIVKVHDPGCDQNGDYVIEGQELKCLNTIWKAFLPQ